MPGMRRLLRVGVLAICGTLFVQRADADTTERVSVDSAGVQANGDSRNPSLSADGRFVAFESAANALVVGDTNGVTDVFVYDRLTGVTERVSVNSAEIQGDAVSSAASISADGRFVAFHSGSTNLVANDINGVDDIFVRDRQNGTTERVSVSSAAISGNGNSRSASISGDGRFVAFYSAATNLVTGDTNGWSDVFVHDRLSGTTERASVTSSESQVTGGNSQDPSISRDGRLVAFHSFSMDVVAGDTNGASDVFVRDRIMGTTTRASVSSIGLQGNSGSIDSSMSADGRFVAFASASTNLVAGDTNGEIDIFVRDRLLGVTERVSISTFGVQGNDRSDGAAISGDGRFVAFHSSATNITLFDLNGATDTFVRDRLRGATLRASVPNGGGAANGTYNVSPSISADSRFVAFFADATNLVASDTNGADDVFVRDRGAQPDGNNDFLADFGAAGTWQRLNDTTWQKIHNASPAVMAAGDLNGNFQHEAVMSFGGAGVWARYDNATWMKLHSGAPSRIVVGDFDGNGTDDLVTDFGSAGIWVRKNNSAWMKLHNGTSQDLAVGNLDGNGKDELIVDFGGAGLWVRYNDSTWAKRHNASPVHIATGDLDGNGKDELVADFGGAGLWVRYNNATWAKLHNGTSQDIVVGDLDGNDQVELIVDFGGAGLWVRTNNATWAKLHNASPVRMIAADLDGGGRSDLVADFGGAGLWVRYNNATWTKIHPASTQDLAAGGFD